MKTFIVDWESKGNANHGTVVVHAASITEAQDKFWVWLKTKPVFQHLWSLSFSIEEGEVA